MQVSTAEFKKGLRIVFDRQPYQVVDLHNVIPARARLRRTKLKHMRRVALIATTFRAGRKSSWSTRK